MGYRALPCVGHDSGLVGSRRRPYTGGSLGNDRPTRGHWVGPTRRTHIEWIRNSLRS